MPQYYCDAILPNGDCKTKKTRCLETMEYWMSKVFAKNIFVDLNLYKNDEPLEASDNPITSEVEDFQAQYCGHDPETAHPRDNLWMKMIEELEEMPGFGVSADDVYDVCESTRHRYDCSLDLDTLFAMIIGGSCTQKTSRKFNKLFKSAIFDLPSIKEIMEQKDGCYPDVQIFKNENYDIIISLDCDNAHRKDAVLADLKPIFGEPADLEITMEYDEELDDGESTTDIIEHIHIAFEPLSVIGA